MRRLLVALLALLVAGPAAAQIGGTPGIVPNPRAIVGNLTGNVTGNVIGNLTGNVNGDVAGNLTGHVTDTSFVTPVNAVAATGTLAYSGTNVAVLTAATYIYTYTDANLAAANDTVIITDGVTPKTYKFVATVAAEGDVLIGTADATIANLVCALNKTGCAENTDWKAAAANPLVSATASTTGAGTGTLTLTGRTAGTAANSIALDATFAGSAFFPDASLAGGLDAESVVLGSQTYKFVTTVAANYEVKKGTSADDSAANLNNAINMAAAVGVGDNAASGKYMAPVANTSAVGVLDTSPNTIVLTALTKGVAGNSITLTAPNPEYSVSDAFSATPTGVDGTAGAKGDIRWDATGLYLCAAANTISGANWVKATLATY